MLNRTGSVGIALGLVTLALACGSSGDNTSDTSSTAGSNAAAGASTAGSGGAGGASSQGGSSGTSTAGNPGSAGQTSTAGRAGSGGSSTGGSSTGGQSGLGGSSSAGNGNGGGPASTEGLAFSGSCLNTDHCTDEWDVSFGAAALEQICTSQQGTWSTGHCAAAPWKKKCTQSVFGGVYVQYLPADGICAAGFEEQL